MCLAEIYTDADMNRIVEELPEVAPGVAILQKVVSCVGGLFGSAYHLNYTFEGGHRKADSTKHTNSRNQSYWLGFHFDINPDIIDQTCGKTEAILECFVLKKDITAIGKCGLGYVVIVASTAFFPTYPETEAKLEDFLKWLKDNDPEYVESLLPKRCTAVAAETGKLRSLSPCLEN